MPGLTQEQMAVKAGISYRHYQELEQGKVNPTMRTLFELASVLKRPIAELIEVEPRRAGHAAPLATVTATPLKRGRKPKRRKPATRG